jgi:solute carrier family 25 (mitochondrial carnitine/acylcarnitine transporter), member 20/29
MLEDAYRQNRMATAAAVRHLHSLRIKSPIFGLVWASGSVRAHVDWCRCEEGKTPIILSAPYPGDRNSEETSDIFYEWQLDQPSDILQVYFLIRNIDHWTTAGHFRDRVMSGIKDLLEGVVHNEEKYEPWKRAGDLIPSALTKVHKENVNISMTTESSESSPKMKSRKHRAQ